MDRAQERQAAATQERRDRQDRRGPDGQPEQRTTDRFQLSTRPLVERHGTGRRIALL